MIEIDRLSINITDICDMNCAHCLRGDGHGRKLDVSLIPKIFENISSVQSLTITGGEPGCNIEAVSAIVNYLKDHKNDIHVMGCFIATNGKQHHQELVDAVKTLLWLELERNFDMEKKVITYENAKMNHSFMEEYKYQFGIAVSLDMFHEPIPMENYMKYYVSGIYQDVKEIDYSRMGVISRGRGANLKQSHYRESYGMCIEHESDELYVDEIYVSVDGNVFTDCDISYEMEEYESESYGDLYESSLADIIKEYDKRSEEE